MRNLYTIVALTAAAAQSKIGVSAFTVNGIISPAFATSSASMSELSLSAASTESATTPNKHQITNDGVYIVNEMPSPLPQLKNTYYLLRHGQSWGNVEGVISSARSLATSEKHGLTPLGYEQGKSSAENLISLIKRVLQQNSNGSNEPKNVIFYSSPFSRARQTAQACLDGIAEPENQNMIEELGLTIQNEIKIEDGLMERFFGRLDDEPIHTYAYVWPVDMYDCTHVAFEVESVAAVSTRLRETILTIEEATEDEGNFIVLTSHADVLQIMQLYAAGASNVGKFSSYRFGNGEVREMGRTVDTLPEPQPLQPPTPGT